MFVHVLSFVLHHLVVTHTMIFQVEALTFCQSTLVKPLHIGYPMQCIAQFQHASLLSHVRFEHAAMHRHIQTTNAIESLGSLVRQRTDQIDVFTTETSCLSIVWATIQDIRLHKLSLA